MTYEIDLKATIKVQFSDPKKAKEFFLEGDWKDHFFDFSDLTEVAEHLAWGFQQNGTDVEGFAVFKRDHDCYISSADEYGMIYIKTTQELEVDYTDEDAVEIVEG